MSLEQYLTLKRASALAPFDDPSFGLRHALAHMGGVDNAITAHHDALNAQFDAARLVLAASVEGSRIARQLRDLNDPFSEVGCVIQDTAVGKGLRFLTDQANSQLAARLDELRATVDSITADPAFPFANAIGRLIDHASQFDDLKSLARSAIEPSAALQRTMDEAAAHAARLATPFDDLQAFARSIVGSTEAFERMVDRLTSTAADGSLPSDDADVAVTADPGSCDGDVAEAPTPVDMMLANAVADVDESHEAADLDRSRNVRLASGLVVVIYTLAHDLQTLARREGLLAADGSFVLVNVTTWLIARYPVSARQIDGAARALSAQLEALFSPRGSTRSGSESVSCEQLEWTIDLAHLVRRLLHR